MQIVEHDDERGAGGGGLDELAHGPGDLLRRARQRLPAEDRVKRARRGRIETQLCERLVRRRAKQLLHCRSNRPIADPFAVGEAAAADHGRAVEALEKLRRQTRFSDSRGSENREEMARPLGDHVCECAGEELPLALPPHHRDRLSAGSRLDGRHAQKPKGRYALGLALQLERSDGLDLDRVLDEAQRFRAE